MDQTPTLKPSIAERLDIALGLDAATEAKTKEVVQRKPAEVVSSGNEDTDFDTDFNVARGMLHHQAETMSDLSDTASFVAKEKQDARSFEAAALVGKEARETALSFIDLHQKKADMKNAGRKTGDTITQNNAVFVGTTGELLKLTRDMNLREAANVIDVAPDESTETKP